jgi:hypothetical protein
LALDLAALQSQALQDMTQRLRNRANEYHLLSQNDQDNALVYKMCAYLMEFSAGALPGFLGGYASHLILDSTTPCGLPLV